VHISLVSPGDPNGEAFGAKVSPWTEVMDPNGGAMRFGQSGLRCSFSLAMARGAPAMVSDIRFAENVHLRVRLLVSAMPAPSRNWAWEAASQVLPTSVVEGVGTELDEATSKLEAEALLRSAHDRFLLL